MLHILTTSDTWRQSAEIRAYPANSLIIALLSIPAYALMSTPYGSNTQPSTSCRFPVVVIQHPAEPFAPKHRSGQLPHCRRRSDERIVKSLVIPLRVIVFDVV